MTARVSWDKEVDMVYVAFRDGPDAHSVFLPDGRSYELSSEGDVVGLEFIDARNGINLNGLPVRPASLLPLLEEKGLTVLGYTVDLPEESPEDIKGEQLPSSLVLQQSEVSETPDLLQRFASA